jgi:hypothetical protein
MVVAVLLVVVGPDRLPIIRSISTAVAASGLPLERGGFIVVVRGLSGPTTTNNTATITFQR